MELKKLLTAFTLLLVLASCKKNGGTTHYVPENLKQLVPYSHGQQIKFSSGSTEVISTVEIKASHVPLINCIICNRYDFEENIVFKFMTGNKVFVQLQLDLRPTIFMRILSPLHSYVSGESFDMMVNSGELSFACSANRHNCLTTVTLNGKQYTDILEISSVNQGADIITQAYYSKIKGLVGFKYGNGTIFTLVE